MSKDNPAKQPQDGVTYKKPTTAERGSVVGVLRNATSHSEFGSTGIYLMRLFLVDLAAIWFRLSVSATGEADMQGLFNVGDEIQWEDSRYQTHYGVIETVSDDAVWATVREHQTGDVFELTIMSLSIAD